MNSLRIQSRFGRFNVGPRVGKRRRAEAVHSALRHLRRVVPRCYLLCRGSCPSGVAHEGRPGDRPDRAGGAPARDGRASHFRWCGGCTGPGLPYGRGSGQPSPRGGHTDGLTTVREILVGVVALLLVAPTPWGSGLNLTEPMAGPIRPSINRRYSSTALGPPVGVMSSSHRAAADGSPTPVELLGVASAVSHDLRHRLPAPSRVVPGPLFCGRHARMVVEGVGRSQDNDPGRSPKVQVGPRSSEDRASVS